MIDRAELLALLDAHVPADHTEACDLEEMRRFARTLGDPVSRDEPEAHFTASAIVVDPAGERTLFIHHRKSGNWLQPGGHVEPTDDTLAGAAEREAREETGLDGRAAALLDVDRHWIPWDGHWHLDLRFLVECDGEPAHQAAEVHGARWLTWDEAYALVRERPLARALAKARAIGS